MALLFFSCKEHSFQHHIYIITEHMISTLSVDGGTKTHLAIIYEHFQFLFRNKFSFLCFFLVFPKRKFFYTIFVEIGF